MLTLKNYAFYRIMMKKYELLFVLPGTMDEREAEAKSQELSAVLKEHQAPMVDMTFLGKNRLAYPVEQIRYGYFYTAVFETTPEQVKNLNNKLSLRRDLLRQMVTYFNVELNQAQKVAYSGETMGTMPFVDRTNPAAAVAAPAPTVMVEKETPVAAAANPEPPRKKEEPVDLDDINRKLDQILSGDNIIPGV